MNIKSINKSGTAGSHWKIIVTKMYKQKKNRRLVYRMRT